MKRTFKLTMAALATIALASCSSDDLFGSADGKLNKNALEVTMEDAIDPVTMRTAYVPNANPESSLADLFWQQDDEIRVYDGTMIRYDKYQFDQAGGAFTLYGKPTANLKEVEYAFFSNEYLDDSRLQTGWDYESNSVYVKASIDKEIDTYAEDEKSVGNGAISYQNYLPLWGTAKNENGKVSVDLKYLTAILRVDLSNVKGNVSKVTVKGWADVDGTKPVRMNGDFIAYLTKDGVIDNNAYLVSESEEPAQEDVDNKIEVTLDGKVEKTKTMVLIPLIVQRYGKLEIKAEGSGVSGTGVIKTAYGLNAERRTFYKAGSNEYSFQGETITDINAALEEYATETGDVTITAASESTKNDVDLQLPAMKATTVTINLKKLVKDGDATSLSITGQYAGTLVLNMDEVENLTNINVLTASANVQIAGRNLSSVTIGGSSAATQAKTLTIAAPEPTEQEVKAETTPVTKIGNITLTEEFVGDVVLGQNTEVAGLTIPTTGSKIKSIALNGKLEGNAITLSAEDKTTLSIGGKADIQVKVTTHQDKLTVAGEAKVSEVDCVALEIKDAAVVATASVSGDATVARTTEGEAISTSLNMTKDKDGAKLTLSGGYIQSLTATNKITIVNTEAIQTAIKNASVTLSADYTSSWCGKPISLKKLDDAGKETAEATDFADYNEATEIWTATQLASIPNSVSSEITLKCNIDLKKAAWTPVELNADFTGGDKKISNLSIDVEGDNVGLFGKVATGKTIKNLTIENAVVKSSELMDEDGEEVEEQGNNVGVLVGQAEGALTLNKVSVTGTSSVEAAYETAENVGGLVGKAAGAFTATEAKVTISKIKGQYNLGGVVGYAADNATITDEKTVADVAAFAVNNPVKNPTIAGENIPDLKAGAIGMYFGKVGGNMSLKQNTTKNVIKGKREELGFEGNFKHDDTHYYAYYGDTDNNVGQLEGTYDVDGASKTKATKDYNNVAAVPATVHGAYVVLNCADYE